MTTRRQLLLEGNRIVDADGNTVGELTSEGRQLMLRAARMRALLDREVSPEDDPVFGPIIAQARRRVERMSPAEREASRARVEAYRTDVRRRSAERLQERLAERERKLAEIEKAIPDDTMERLPLFHRDA